MRGGAGRNRLAEVILTLPYYLTTTLTSTPILGGGMAE